MVAVFGDPHKVEADVMHGVAALSVISHCLSPLTFAKGDRLGEYHRKSHAEAPRLKARVFNLAHGSININFERITLPYYN